jgi:hypothetical protein
MISILLGSGFSIPEGVKSVTQLNERLNKIDADDIYVHTDKKCNVCIHTYKYIHTFMQTYIHTYIHKFMHICR